MSKFFKAVWDRVVKSYKSTLVGLAFGVALTLIDQFVLAVQSDNRPLVQAAAALAAIIGASLKSKALPPSP